jgi:hypothetical protein
LGSRPRREYPLARIVRFATAGAGALLRGGSEIDPCPLFAAVVEEVEGGVIDQYRGLNSSSTLWHRISGSIVVGAGGPRARRPNRLSGLTVIISGGPFLRSAAGRKYLPKG